MAQLIVTAFVSLDGVMEDPGGGTYRHAGWTFSEVPFVEEAYELKGREQEEATAMMLGRVSYQSFAPVWPEMAEFARYAGEYILLQDREVRWHGPSADWHRSRREIAGNRPESALYLKYVDPEECEEERYGVYEATLKRMAEQGF